MVGLGLLDVVDKGAARCVEEDVDARLFFSELMAEVIVAKALCGECSQLGPCLRGATARREPWGVWGGKVFVDGVAVEFKRPRGRPRKTPLAVA
jgi:WhiB family redox-sensing transcriptional regulator